MGPEKYLRFTIEDYLCDDDFLRFAVNPEEADQSFWQNFIRSYPSEEKKVNLALELIQLYRQQNTHHNGTSQSAVFSSITKSIREKEKKSVFKFTRSTFYRIAACLVLAAMSIFLYRYFYPNITQTTAYAEVKVFVLPDGSQVTLNGNSKMHYARNFKEGKREVWIEGEALFEVKHLNTNPQNIKPGEKFTVHCDDLDVTVLGTTFNVKNRREKTDVGLLSGKVVVRYNQQNHAKPAEIVLAPGDYLRQTSNAKPRLQKLADPSKLTVWVKHQLSFQDATLDEMVQVLEDDLGYKVNVEADSIRTNRIEGDINVANVKDLLRIISTTQHVTIQQNDKTITIKP